MGSFITDPSGLRGGCSEAAPFEGNSEVGVILPSLKKAKIANPPKSKPTARTHFTLVEILLM
jgi:hypothetical protein